MNRYNNFTRKIALVILITCMVMMFNVQLFATTVQRDDAKRVLLISSYSPSFESFFQQIEGIKSQFDEDNIVLDVEFMDSKRLYTKENMDNFHRTLRYKLSKFEKYDAVLVADDNALEYVLTHQEDEFNEIPIVFFGINDFKKAIETSKNPFITGIIEEPSLAETIEVANKINKKAKRVLAITDNTNSGQATLKTFYHIKNKFPKLEFGTLDLSKMNYEEFGKKLRKTDEEDILILLSVYRDKDNFNTTLTEGIEFISRNCDQPIFHPYENGLGKGVVGGKVISMFEQGSKAASILKEVFKGRDISTIKLVSKSPNKYKFDKLALDRFKINENLLPEGSIIINKEVSFFEQYFWYIVATCIVLIMQTALILFLQINITRRKKSEIELLDNREELMVINEELVATNEELIASLDEVKIQDEKIHSLVYTDMVTGLSNRLSIFKEIDKLIEDKYDKVAAIMFLDVDNFKNINDTYGHDIGDKVLELVGKKLKCYDNGRNISVGRFGGDEFLIILRNPVESKDIIKNVETIKNVFAEEIYVEGNMLSFTVSMGISLYPNHGKDRGELVKKADLALYKAKRSGKNKFVFYDSTMDEVMKEKMVIQEAIKKAIKRDEFYLNYQPYVDTHTREIIGFEALIRWKSEELGQVSPYKLVTNAEEIGLMMPIGEFVFREACKFAKLINEKSEKEVKVSINISALQLMCHDFFTKTMSIIDEIGIDPRLLCLEMTETILIESLEKGTDVINKLKDQGFVISLDDFGTGYSSLKYFKELPVDILKIDKSFVDNITSSSYSRNLTEAMINIAHYKDVHVVAEGVEELNQYDILKDYSCDMIQGYLFSKPLDEDKAIELSKSDKITI